MYPIKIHLVICYDQGFGFFNFRSVWLYRERLFRQYWKWLEGGCPERNPRGS